MERAVWINDSGGTGLGHRRLSIIDLSSAGAQPMHYLDRYTIIHNGEIYNYLELRDLLQSKGYSFSSEQTRKSFLPPMIILVPAVFNILMACSPLPSGTKKKKNSFWQGTGLAKSPYFSTGDEEQFLFASEIKALWAAGVKKESNKKMLFNFITIGYTQNPANPFETFFLGISKLPARSFLLYDAITQGFETTAWWDIEVGKTLSCKEDTAIDEFSHLLSDSVNKRLRSDVSVGTSLSGGLDSSSIVACILQQVNAPQRLPTFSAVFPGFERDESPFVNLLSSHFSLENHPTTPLASDLIRDFEKLIHHQEEPFLSSSIYAQFRYSDWQRNIR